MSDQCLEAELWYTEAQNDLPRETHRLQALAKHATFEHGELIVHATRDVHRQACVGWYFPALAATCQRIAHAGYLQHIHDDRWRLTLP